MLSNSVVILIREVLEAALLCAAILAMCRQFSLSIRAVWVALVLGLAAAIGYAKNLATIAGWFDGVGQEVGDAASQFALVLLLPLIVMRFIRRYYRHHRSGDTLVLTLLVGAALVLAVMREGAEIYLYVASFQWQPEKRQALAIGALIGSGIGFSIGALVYYLLRLLPKPRGILVAGVVLNLVAGGMAVQGCKMLIQADWLPDGEVWNSSWLVPEDSVTGQLLYALMGYEATPAPVQVFAYVIVLGVIVLSQGAIVMSYRNKT
ncbi:Iron permease FTR1 family [Spongiibacter sp. IMCC21906]|uniref:FTR1 family protein n=1 Tax=Spongiibacter sp. IMCC21906 TaxID=1620392 RepID=UPI00062DF1E2|nr:FTR1 family protein [Spongiibacter sp. IMCC21906]AKH70829.1 Iron permease FTR1 family [Spongiibacter sp. IMCC21906]